MTQKMTVVIVPLIAVIQDQANAIRALALKGVIITVCTIIAGQSDPELANAEAGKVGICKELIMLRSILRYVHDLLCCLPRYISSLLISIHEPRESNSLASEAAGTRKEKPPLIMCP